MSSSASPGPSSVAPSIPISPPIVPSTARRLTINRRVVNLRDRPDSTGITADLSNGSSLDISANDISLTQQDRSRQITPPMVNTVTDMTKTTTENSASNEGTLNGKKGILRTVGTPGSGNGVRFYPKNRFRVITPNQSVLTPQKAQPPQSPSFFSQLLAVSFPSISSPKPSSTTSDQISLEKRNVHDDSWEVPGQEGEVSLLSAASFEQGNESSGREDGASLEIEEEESWHGEPQIICSPLALPTAEATPITSRETSFQDIELPSADWQLPQNISEVSNLLSTRMSPPPGDSFSINYHSPIGQGILNFQPQNPYSPSTGTGGRSIGNESSMISKQGEISPMGEDGNPSIRRLSPLPKSPALSSSNAVSPQTLTPVPPSQAFSSIFADMSAEQANFSWPVTRRLSEGDEDVVDGETIFHSAIFKDLSVGQTGDISPNKAVDVKTPKSTSDIEATRYYDFSPDVDSPNTASKFLHLQESPSTVIASRGIIGPSTNSPSKAMTIQSGLRNVHSLIEPSRELFSAQETHTSALRNELELYRSLVQKLQGDIAERDGYLADLKIRGLESEMLKAQVVDLQKELEKVKSASINNTAGKSQQTLKAFSRPVMDSPSPSPLFRRPSFLVENDHVGDRTTTLQAERRDLEIRLAKSSQDVEQFTKELAETRNDRDRLAEEMRVLKEEKRDADVRDELGLVEVRKERDEALSLVAKLRLEAEEAGTLLAEHEDIANEREEAITRVSELEKEIEDMNQARVEEVQESEEVWREKLEKVEEERDQALERGLDLTIQIEQLEERLQAVSEPSSHLGGDEVPELESRIEALETKLEEMREIKKSDEEEIDRLTGLLQKSRDGRGREEKMRGRVEELEKGIEVERFERVETERRVKELEESRKRLEAVNKDLEKECSSLRQKSVLSEKEAQARIQQLMKERDDLRTKVDSSSSKATKGETNDETRRKLLDEIARLRSESSSKDLEIVTLQKRKNELKEDREMLNVALDSKQQEVELMKRKFQVRGIAGSTPLGDSAKRLNVQKSSQSPDLITPAPHRRMVSSTMGSVNGNQHRRKSSFGIGYGTPINGLDSIKEKTGEQVKGRVGRVASTSGSAFKGSARSGGEGRETKMLVSSVKRDGGIVEPRRSARGREPLMA